MNGRESGMNLPWLIANNTTGIKDLNRCCCYIRLFYVSLNRAGEKINRDKRRDRGNRQKVVEREIFHVVFGKSEKTHCIMAHQNKFYLIC